MRNTGAYAEAGDDNEACEVRRRQSAKGLLLFLRLVVLDNFMIFVIH